MHQIKSTPGNYSNLCPILFKSNQTLRLDVTREDSLRRFFAKHSIAMLEQCCNHLKQCRNNVATLCCSKNRCCD